MTLHEAIHIASQTLTRLLGQRFFFVLIVSDNKELLISSDLKATDVKHILSSVSLDEATEQFIPEETVN
jgi:hypothetical protein